MKFYDKVKYEAFATEWAMYPAFTFYASVVASADEIKTGILQNIETYDNIVVQRVNTSATQPHFFVYRSDDEDADILFRVYPE